MTLDVAVYGAVGRMGRSIIERVLEDDQARLVAAIEQSGVHSLSQDVGIVIGCGTEVGVAVTDSLDKGLSRANVVVDFSLPLATQLLMDACGRRKIPAVIGTTGIDPQGLVAIEKLSKVAPVVVAPNFSVGVNVLWYLAGRAVELLGPDFDTEIVEMHHRNKVDAPSGTAVRLAQVVAKARGIDEKQACRYGRKGDMGVRTRDEIGMLALRGGDVVGEHTLILAGSGERVELTHRSYDRKIFASGAIRAAHWVVNQQPGLYDMVDVLGLPR